MELINAYKYIYGRDVILADLPKKYEVINAYMRWIIINVSSGYDNFGNISETTKQDKKFAQELKEKNISISGLAYIDKLKGIIVRNSNTQITINDRPPGITISIDISEMGTKPIYISSKIALDTTPTRAEIPQLLRYFAIGFDGSQHWALSRDSYIGLISTMEPFNEEKTLECFASPYNHQFANYCSIYAEKGTYGNFFENTNGNKIEDLSFHTYLINPPFIEDILTAAASRALDLCACGYLVIFIGPNWLDADFYNMLHKSKYLCKITTDFHEYRTLGNKKVSAMKTTHFILKIK